jgi:tripartite ATP-independent transporter DctP family solute receptor
MKRRIWFSVLALTLSLVLLCGCGASVSESGGKYQNIRLVMAVNGTDTQIDSRVARYFAELVAERSGGSVTVDVFPNDQLAGGNATKGIEMIAMGSVDLAAYATCTLAVIDSQLPVATIPWSFDSYTQAREVIDATGGDYYAERLAAKGITYIGSFHNGFRQLTNSKTVVDDPADLKNLKIRVPGSEVYMGFFRALGADPTSMSWSEVFTAIQQGTIDGQENGASVTSTAKMDEIQKYMTIWNYSYENDLFVINTKIWDSLPENTQQLIQTCATEACNWGRDKLEADEEALIQGFRDVGMQVDILDEEQLKPFQDQVADVVAALKAEYGEEACAAFGL